MHYFLIVLGVILLVVGLFYLSNATVGVGLICSACFLGIMARIAQAGAHRNRTKAEREEGVKNS
jgi:hypothetical protein